MTVDSMFTTSVGRLFIITDIDPENVIFKEPGKDYRYVYNKKTFLLKFENKDWTWYNQYKTKVYKTTDNL